MVSLQNYFYYVNYYFLNDSFNANRKTYISCTSLINMIIPLSFSKIRLKVLTIQRDIQFTDVRQIVIVFEQWSGCLFDKYFFYKAIQLKD
jgi:hypothetical protein